eukprot:jgi/Astpho2/5453/fgenesh1_pg.00077_%23_3_t
MGLSLWVLVAKSWIWPSPAREADMHHMMRRLSGSSHTVQMELASSAYQDGQKHSYLVLEYLSGPGLLETLQAALHARAPGLQPQPEDLAKLKLLGNLLALHGASQSESEWPNNYAKEDYESPELVRARMAGELGSTVNLPAQDMWALGACLLKLLTDYFPRYGLEQESGTDFANLPSTLAARNWAKGWACNAGPDMHPGLAMLRRLDGEEMYDLVQHLLHSDLHQRFTAAQALETPFLKRLAAEETVSALARAWQQAQSTAWKLAPAPHLTVSVARKKQLRLQPMPFAAGNTGLVHQGWDKFKPCKQRAVKVIEVSGPLAELQITQELHALRIAQPSKAVPRLVGSYRVGKQHYIITALVKSRRTLEHYRLEAFKDEAVFDSSSPTTSDDEEESDSDTSTSVDWVHEDYIEATQSIARIVNMLALHGAKAGDAFVVPPAGVQPLDSAADPAGSAAEWGILQVLSPELILQLHSQQEDGSEGPEEERCRGQAAVSPAQQDMWQLGANIVRMATGRWPLLRPQDERPEVIVGNAVIAAKKWASHWEEFVEEDGVTVPRQRELRDVYKYHGVELLDLVRQLLHPDPAKRLTPQQALCHPYVHRQAVMLKWVPEDSPSTHVLRLPAVIKEQPRRARGAKWKPPSTRAGRLGGRLATVARTALCISCLCPTVVPEDDDANTETDYFESAGGGNQAGEEDSRASGSEDSAGCVSLVRRGRPPPTLLLVAGCRPITTLCDVGWVKEKHVIDMPITLKVGLLEPALASGLSLTTFQQGCSEAIVLRGVAPVVVAPHGPIVMQQKMPTGCFMLCCSVHKCKVGGFEVWWAQAVLAVVGCTSWGLVWASTVLLVAPVTACSQAPALPAVKASLRLHSAVQRPVLLQSVLPAQLDSWVVEMLDTTCSQPGMLFWPKASLHPRSAVQVAGRKTQSPASRGAFLVPQKKTTRLLKHPNRHAVVNRVLSLTPTAQSHWPRDIAGQGSTQLIPATYGRGLAASTTLLDGADLVSATGAATETALPMLTPRDTSVEEDSASAGPAGSASKAEADTEPGTHTPRLSDNIQEVRCSSLASQ